MKNRSIWIMVALLNCLLGGNARAVDEKKTEKPKVTPEMRQKMAGVHQKMADCLRSDKPMSECKQEMMKSCHEIMGKDDCPMMGDMHGHMKGMMGNGHKERHPLSGE